MIYILIILVYIISSATMYSDVFVIAALSKLYRPTHAHVTRSVMLIFLESVTTHNASATILKVTQLLLACVVCTCQVGFHLKFPLSSKLSALKTTYQFRNIIFYLSSISITNRSLYNSRKRQFLALEDSMCEDDLFLFWSCFDDVMINPIIPIVNAMSKSLFGYAWSL